MFFRLTYFPIEIELGCILLLNFEAVTTHEKFVFIYLFLFLANVSTPPFLGIGMDTYTTKAKYLYKRVTRIAQLRSTRRHSCMPFRLLVKDFFMVKQQVIRKLEVTRVP